MRVDYNFGDIYSLIKYIDDPKYCHITLPFFLTKQTFCNEIVCWLKLTKVLNNNSERAAVLFVNKTKCGSQCWSL